MTVEDVSSPVATRAAPARWLTRSDLPAAVGPPRVAEGWLVASPEADVVVPVDPAELADLSDITAETLASAGIDGSARLLIAINNDGAGVGSVLARAGIQTAAATCSVGPRGRMRILRAIESVQPDTLVITPTGAADLLARLLMEFLVDPAELGLKRLVLLGEIATPAAYRHLASEYGVELVELWCDPLYGAALGYRHPLTEPGFTLTRPWLVGLAALDRDELCDPAEPGWAEWVLRADWSSGLRDAAVRTGVVSAQSGGADAPAAPGATVGDHVLVRGRWLSLPVLDRALRRIDGIVGWTLEIRRDGTLDAAHLRVRLNRESLVGNGMWASRVRDAVRSITPVEIGTELVGPGDGADGPQVVDHRGHHLGRDRAAAARMPRSEQ